MKNTGATNQNIKKVKRQPILREKIFAKYISD